MSLTLIPYNITLQAATYYTCDLCGCTKRGSGFTVELEELPNLRQLEKTVPNAHLPFGWVGNGIGVAYCQNCKSNRE